MIGLPDLFTDYTLRNVALGATILGIVGGVLGSFAVLRRQSLLGDALAHAALPGICLAFLVAGGKVPLWLLAGGGLAAWAGALSVLAILRHTRLPEDAALGVVLASFFGFGIALLTFVQHGGNATQAGLDKFLFGQAATIVQGDVITMALIGGTGLAVVWLLYKEFKLLTFDPEFTAALGFPARRLGTLLTSLTVVAVVVGLQTVGVVLMAAMLVAPAAAARQWTDRFGRMVALSALFGAASGVTGAVLSATGDNLPTGPLVILCASVIVAVSLLLAPNRGIVWARLRDAGNRRRLRVDRLLLDAHVLYGHGELTPERLAARRRVTLSTAATELQELAARGWAASGRGGWALTPAGDREAHALEARMRVGRPADPAGAAA